MFSSTNYHVGYVKFSNNSFVFKYLKTGNLNSSDCVVSIGVATVSIEMATFVKPKKNKTYILKYYNYNFKFIRVHAF